MRQLKGSQISSLVMPFYYRSTYKNKDRVSMSNLYNGQMMMVVVNRRYLKSLHHHLFQDLILEIVKL
jgi:hypothetical protein